MNMFKSVKATSIKEYFDTLPEERKEPMLFLDTFIKKHAPSLKPVFSYNMPGYGMFKYKNYKGDIIDWPTIALASQKNYISLYICAIENNEYLAEKYKQSLSANADKSKLGKISVGKSCIRFKKIEDLNLEVLKKVIKLAAKSPGLVGAKEIN